MRRKTASIIGRIVGLILVAALAFGITWCATHWSTVKAESSKLWDKVTGQQQEQVDPTPEAPTPEAPTPDVDPTPVECQHVNTYESNPVYKCMNSGDMMLPNSNGFDGVVKGYCCEECPENSEIICPHHHIQGALIYCLDCGEFVRYGGPMNVGLTGGFADHELQGDVCICGYSCEHNFVDGTCEHCGNAAIHHSMMTDEMFEHMTRADIESDLGTCTLLYNSSFNRFEYDFGEYKLCLGWLNDNYYFFVEGNCQNLSLNDGLDISCAVGHFSDLDFDTSTIIQADEKWGSS